jgi:hypothetical protein
MYLYFANGLPFVYLLVGQVAASSKLRAKGHQATNLFGSWILPVQLPFTILCCGFQHECLDLDPSISFIEKENDD